LPSYSEGSKMDFLSARAKMSCLAITTGLVAALLSSCNHKEHAKDPQMNTEYHESPSDEPAVTTASALHNCEGAYVTVRGTAYNERLGAAIALDKCGVILVGKHAWSRDTTGHDVIVSGRLVRRDYRTIEALGDENRVTTTSSGVHWFVEDVTIHNGG
jgi:hypothetical protein